MEPATSEYSTPNSKSIDCTEPPTQEQIMTRSRTGTIVSPQDRL